MELNVEFPEKLEFLFQPSRYKVWYLAEQRGESPADLCDQQIEAYETAAQSAGLLWALEMSKA
jgi:hypothetical protein